MDPIKLSVDKKLSLAQVKKMLTQQHPDRPPPAAMKIIYKGRMLQDEIIISDAINIGLSGALQGGSQAKFHLLIDKRKLPIVAEENKTQAVAARIQAQQAQ